MNLYLVLALALGAVSAAPVPERHAAGVAAEAKIVAQQAVSLAVRRLPIAVTKVVGQAPTVNSQSPTALPLTGATTPRAPARSC